MNRLPVSHNESEGGEPFAAVRLVKRSLDYCVFYAV